MASIKRSVLQDVETKECVLPLTYIKWGEIEGNIKDQKDLMDLLSQSVPTGSATFEFTYLDGTTGSIKVATL